MKKFFYRSINKIFNLINNFYRLMRNIFSLKLFIQEVLINKKKVFEVGNVAIGHFPISMFFSKQMFGSNIVFFYRNHIEHIANPYNSKENVSHSNAYLKKKTAEVFNFDQKYAGVFEIMKAVKVLTFGVYNHYLIPDHMYMQKGLNYYKTFDGKTNLFEFNKDENAEGEKFLQKHNINKDNFICFIVRTSEYNKIYATSHLASKEGSVKNFMNVDQDSYILSLNYLANKGYKIIRMGKGFSNPFPFNHKNFFDYAVSSDRNDFLDIWLSANCKFSFGTNNGILHLPAVFNKPVLGTNSFPIGTIQSWLPKSIHLPRVVKRNDHYLTLKEQVELNIIRQINGDYYKSINAEVLENTPEDILGAVKDMENKLEKGFYSSELNMKFWKNLEKVWGISYHGITPTKQNIVFVEKKTCYKTSKKNQHFIKYFNNFHAIKYIKTSIPDFYLKKYEDVFKDT